jgi:uncharacterized membrane protein YdcZ (DUF606 family)
MHPVVKNILAVIAGIVVGSIVNMAIVMTSHLIIPYPEGMILGNMDSLNEYLPQFEPKHFLMPFLAHSLGTLAGAILAYVIAANHKFKFAMGIGVWFLIGGIINEMMLNGPLWYTIVDIGLAYIPFALLATRIVKK